MTPLTLFTEVWALVVKMVSFLFQNTLLHLCPQRTLTILALHFKKKPIGRSHRISGCHFGILPTHQAPRKASFNTYNKSCN